MRKQTKKKAAGPAPQPRAQVSGFKFRSASCQRRWFFHLVRLPLWRLTLQKEESQRGRSRISPSCMTGMSSETHSAHGAALPGSPATCGTHRAAWRGAPPTPTAALMLSAAPALPGVGTGPLPSPPGDLGKATGSASVPTNYCRGW